MTVPNPSIIQAALVCLSAFLFDTRDQAVALLDCWARREEMTAVDVAKVLDQLFPPAAEIGCPDWCLEDHSTDDARDDLVLHMGGEHTDGYVRKLLDPHLLDLRVARTDCPSEGRTGTPNLYVRAELELTTWGQAAELARTILDAFGYLHGADKA